MHSDRKHENGIFLLSIMRNSALKMLAATCLGLLLSIAALTTALAVDAPVNPAQSLSAATVEPSVKGNSSWFAERGQSWHEHELAWILWLQQTKVLQWPLYVITNLGPSGYMLVLLPFVFLCVDPRIGARLALVYFISSGIREALAMIFCFPRPFWIDPRVDTFRYGQRLNFSYSFPSGHALVGTSIWLFAASRIRRPWAWAVGLAIAIAICFSRVYLGVHFPSDVTAGFIGGAILVVVFLLMEAPLTRWWQGQRLLSQCAAASGLAGAMVLGGVLACALNSTRPDPAAWAAFATKARELSRVTEQAGAAMGLGIGLAMGRRWASFEVQGPWLRRLVCWFLGCAPLAAIYLARLAGPADSETIRAAVRFAGALLATWLMTFVVPRLCLRWNLVKPEIPLATAKEYNA